MGGQGSGHTREEWEMVYLSHNPQNPPELYYLPYGPGCYKGENCFNCPDPIDCHCKIEKVIYGHSKTSKN